jgi:uncharacterized protein YqgV (UPF0045/DUF77 family)
MSQQIDAGGASFALRLKDSLTNRLKQVGRNIDAFGKRMQNTGARITSIGKGIAGFGAKITAISGAVGGLGFAAAKSFAGFGDEIGKMSKRLGIAQSSLQEFGFAAEQSGASLSTIETGVRRMQRVINDAGKGMASASDALKQIGLSSADLNGKGTEQQFQMIATALGNVTDATKKAAIAQEIFGRSGTQLLPMFSNGAEGLAALRKEANDLGLVLSDADISQAEELTDSFNRIGRTIKAVFLKIGASVAKPMGDFLDRMAKGAAMVGEFIDKNRQMVATIAKFVVIGAAIGGVILAVAGGVAAIGFVVAGVGAGIGTVVASVTAIVGAIVATFVAVKAAIVLAISPIGLVVIALAAATAAVVKMSGAWDTLADGVSDIIPGVVGAVKRIKAAFSKGGIQAAVKQVSTEVTRAWEIATTRIQLAWQQVVDFVKRVAETASQVAVTAFATAVRVIAAQIDDMAKKLASLVDKAKGLAVGFASGALGAFGGGEAIAENVEAAAQRAKELFESVDLSGDADEFLSTFQSTIAANNRAAQEQRERDIAALREKLHNLTTKPVKIHGDFSQLIRMITKLANGISSFAERVKGAFADLFAPIEGMEGFDKSEERKEGTAGKNIASTNATFAANASAFAPTFDADTASTDQNTEALNALSERIKKFFGSIGEILGGIPDAGQLANSFGGVVAKLQTSLPSVVSGLVSGLNDGSFFSSGSQSLSPTSFPSFSPASIAEGFASDVASFFSNDKGQTDGATEDTAKQSLDELRKISGMKRTFGK